MTKRFLFFGLCCVGLLLAGALVVTAQSSVELSDPFSTKIFLAIPAAVTDEPAATPEVNYYDTTDTPTLTWNRISWATSYDLEVSNDPGFNAPVFYAHSTTQPETDSLSHTVTETLTDGVWYWRVRGVGGEGIGPFSRPERFEVDVAP